MGISLPVIGYTQTYEEVSKRQLIFKETKKIDSIIIEIEKERSSTCYDEFIRLESKSGNIIKIFYLENDSISLYINGLQKLTRKTNDVMGLIPDLIFCEEKSNLKYPMEVMIEFHDFKKMVKFKIEKKFKSIVVKPSIDINLIKKIGLKDTNDTVPKPIIKTKGIKDQIKIELKNYDYDLIQDLRNCEPN